RVGRDVSSSHSRPARMSSANVRRESLNARATAPSAASWPSRPRRIPRRTLSVSIASPSSNVSARRRWRRRRAYASRSSAVGPFSQAWRRSRSWATHASISACVGSSSVASSFIASSDAWTVDPVISTTPLPGHRQGLPAFSGRRVYASDRGPATLDSVVASASGEVEPGRLELGVAVEGVEALVPTEARLLVATEGDGDVGRVEGVDPDDPGPDPARQPMRPVDVARPQAGGEAVRRVVGDGDRLVFVLELGHRQDRAEDLLTR